MTHKILIKKPIAEFAEVLKAKGKVLDTTKTQTTIGDELIYSTLVLNHRQYVLIEKNNKPQLVEFGRNERKRTIYGY